MRFLFYTLGCRCNQFETAAMEAVLRSRGHEIVTDTIRGKNEYGRTSYARYRMVG